jgi:hypothetical protein
MIDDRNQHGGRADRPHFGNLLHHRIGVVIAAQTRPMSALALLLARRASFQILQSACFGQITC